MKNSLFNMNNLKKKTINMDELKNLVSNKASELKEILELVLEDPSISTNTKANIIINATSLVCAVVAVQPLPFADLFVLSPIQVVMVTYLSKTLGLKRSDTSPKELLVYLVNTLGFGVLSQQVILGLYKTIIPFAGAVTTIPLVYAATFGLGMACKTLINAKKNNVEISKEQLKKIREEEMEKIKKENRDWSLENLKKELKEVYRNEYKTYRDNMLRLDNSSIGEAVINKVVEIKERFAIYKGIEIRECVFYKLAFLTFKDIRFFEEVVGQIERRELIFNKGKDISYNISGFAVIRLDNLLDEVIIKDIDLADKNIAGMVSVFYSKNDITNITNEEIRNKFLSSFNDCEEILCIQSPWMNHYVVNDDLMFRIECALKRGVKVIINYGIKEGSNNNNRTDNSDSVAEKLRRRFSLYGEQFQLRRGNSHYKILVCDDKYYIEGSYNFLSFAGQYGSSTDQRHEGAALGHNKEYIKLLKERYFKNR